MFGARVIVCEDATANNNWASRAAVSNQDVKESRIKVNCLLLKIKKLYDSRLPVFHSMLSASTRCRWLTQGVHDFFSELKDSDNAHTLYFNIYIFRPHLLRARTYADFEENFLLYFVFSQILYVLSTSTSTDSNVGNLFYRLKRIG